MRVFEDLIVERCYACVNVACVLASLNFVVQLKEFDAKKMLGLYRADFC